MASGKKNYFRHSFNARNDEFIVSLMNEFKEKGYFMWFALCEMCGEMVSDGHALPLKFNQSRLYKELKCNQRTLTLFLLYCESRSKVYSTYSDSIVSLEIPSLSKYIGKYLEIAPNKRKEKETKEKETKLKEETEIEAEKNLPKMESQGILKPSPLSFLFNESEIKEWLNAGTHETHILLLKKFSHHELAEQIPRAFAWAVEKSARSESWLYTWMSNKKTSGYGLNQGKATFKSKSNGVVATPENPTGNPYTAQRLARENGEIA